MKIIIFIIIACTLFGAWSLCIVGASADEQLEMIYTKDLERKENSMDNTYAPTAPTQEKIKVESIDIVATGPKKKPYYAIKCRKIGSNDDCIGFGSYCLENVIRWKEQCFELVERKSDWIPISERLPDTDEYVLLSFENYTMAAIGRYEENDEGGTFYPGDDEKSYSSYGIFVNAWMPLPEPYRKEQHE